LNALCNVPLVFLGTGGARCVAINFWFKSAFSDRVGHQNPERAAGIINVASMADTGRAGVKNTQRCLSDGEIKLASRA